MDYSKAFMKLYGAVGETEEAKNDSDDPPLTPSLDGKDCLGNGEHEGIECCCDECDYYLSCFPNWNEG